MGRPQEAQIPAEALLFNRFFAPIVGAEKVAFELKSTGGRAGHVKPTNHGKRSESNSAGGAGLRHGGNMPWYWPGDRIFVPWFSTANHTGANSHQLRIADRRRRDRRPGNIRSSSDEPIAWQQPGATYGWRRDATSPRECDGRPCPQPAKHEADGRQQGRAVVGKAEE